MRKHKAVITVVAILALLLAGVAAYIVASFDSARLKAEIERAAEAKTGRKLTLGGTLSLSLFPNIALRIGNLHLSERGKPAQEFATVEQARVSVKLLPLLSKRVEADEIELTGVTARIVKTRSGQRNTDDLTGTSEPGAKAAEPLPRFDVAGVRIEKAAVNYVDEETGRSFALSDFSLKTGRLANAAEGKFSADGKVSGPGLDAIFRTGGRYKVDLDAGKFAAEELEANVKGQSFGITGIDATVTAGAIRMPAQQELSIEKLLLKAVGQKEGDSAEVSAEVPKLSLSAASASSDTLKLDVRLKGKDGPLQLSLQAGELQRNADAVQLGQLALVVDGSRGDLRLNGRLSAALKANMAGKTAELNRVAGELTAAHPAMPMKLAKLALQGHARADWGRSTASGETTLRIDDSTVQTKWDLARMAPLALSIDAAVDRLNVDQYLPAKGKEVAVKSSPPAATPAAAPPIDLKGLQGPDVRGTIRVGALQAANVKLGNLKSDFRLAGGRLDITNFAAKLYGGNVAGSAMVDSHGNRIALKQSLQGVDINPLMRDALGKDLLEGHGNVQLDLNSAGISVDALKRNLAGSASLGLRDGAIKGINLAKTFRELKAKFSSREDTVQKASQTDKTDFSELTASFRVAGGIAHNDDLVAKSPFLRLSGNGNINIGEGTLSYLTKATVVNTSSGQAGKELDQIKGMTIPVRLSGPFDNLAYHIEFSGLVQEAVKAQAQEKVQAKVREIQDKLSDKLKGLLGK